MLFSSAFSSHFLPFLFQFQQHTSLSPQGSGSRTGTQETLRILTQLRPFCSSNSSSHTEWELAGIHPDPGTPCRHNNIPWPPTDTSSGEDRMQGEGVEVNTAQQGQREGRRAKQGPHSPSVAAPASWPPARCSFLQTAPPWRVGSVLELTNGHTPNGHNPLSGQNRYRGAVFPSLSGLAAVQLYKNKGLPSGSRQEPPLPPSASCYLLFLQSSSKMFCLWCSTCVVHLVECPELRPVFLPRKLPVNSM